MRIWLLSLALLLCGRCHAYDYQLSICAIFQDEAPYLKEWIEFHRLVGVEHFYLYNHRSTDDWKAILTPYIASGVVEVTNETTEAADNRTFNKLQSACYTECLKRTRGVSKWVAFIDIDEYLFPVKEQKLNTLLQRYEDCACVCVNWLMFGTSGVRKIPSEKLLIETLTSCTSGSYRENYYVKSIVQPERVTHFLNPHHPQCCEGYSQVNTDKIPLKGPLARIIVRINCALITIGRVMKPTFSKRKSLVSSVGEEHPIQKYS